MKLNIPPASTYTLNTIVLLSFAFFALGMMVSFLIGR